jgi:hypothetical protein
MWYKHLDQNYFLQKLYEQVPELTGIEIKIIEIKDEGRKISLHFDMPVYADYPPEKWIRAGYNTMYVEMDFFSIYELSIQSQGPPYHSDITIHSHTGDLIDIQLHGNIEMSFKAEAGMIQRITGVEVK